MTAACQFQTLKNVEKTEMVFPGDSPVLLLLVQSPLHLRVLFFLLLIVLVVSDFLYGTTILFFSFPATSNACRLAIIYVSFAVIKS